MRAWQVSELGHPIDVLKLCDVEQIDNPASGHVQVSIKAVGISFPDVLQCRCLLYTSPSPRDVEEYRMPSSA